VLGLGRGSAAGGPNGRSVPGAGAGPPPRCGVWPDSGPPRAADSPPWRASGPGADGDVPPGAGRGGAESGADDSGAAGVGVTLDPEAEALATGEVAGAEARAGSAGGGLPGTAVGRADRPGLCCDSAVAVELMAGVSDGVGRWAGAGGVDATVRGAAVFGVAAAGEVGATGDDPDPVISCLIRSTIGGSRLARALDFTSRPHFWNRSSSSWLFRPSSFANSWTRVDNGNSSWVGPRPVGRSGPSDRSIMYCSDRSDQAQFAATTRFHTPRLGGSRRGRAGGSVCLVIAIGPRDDMPVRGLMVGAFPNHVPRPHRPGTAPLGEAVGHQSHHPRCGRRLRRGTHRRRPPR
jgi:hypothetical protein